MSSLQKRKSQRAMDSRRQPPREELIRQVAELTKRISRLTSNLGSHARKTNSLQMLLAEVTNQREEIRIQNEQLCESQLLLEESRDRYANLYDFAPVACLTLCEHGIIREINLSGASLLGHWRARLLERPLLQFVEREYRSVFLEHLRRCRDEPQSVTTELVFCDAGGRTFPAELTSVRAASEELGVTNLRSVILDMTERKRAEAERLRLQHTEESERLLKAVLEALPVGVRVLDADGKVILYNDTSDQIWGGRLRSLAQWADLGARSARTGHALNSVTAWPGWIALKDGQTVLNELIEMPRRAATDTAAAERGNGQTATEADNGMSGESAEEIRFISESAVPLRDDSNVVMGAVLVSEDVTRQILAQRRLRNAKESAELTNRLKDEFLAIASHELRTPISSVLLWIHLLRKSIDNPKERREALDMVEQSARAQSHLINDLLDVARLETGKLELRTAKMDLGPMVRAVVDSVRPTAEATGISLNVDVGDEPVVAMFDDDRVRQILLNVLGNALKFTPAEGRVDVTLRAKGDHAEITVVDTGQGIAPEFLPFVFERFRQADATMTRQHGGMGLGLTISRQLAEMHGGTLTAESAGPGQGSTFRLTLPIAGTHQQYAETAGESTVPALTTKAAPEMKRSVMGKAGTKRRGSFTLSGALTGLRVLLVEDEETTRAALARVLRASGATVTVTASGAEARAAFQRAGDRRPDILLSDISMPDVDGYTLLGQLRALELKSKQKNNKGQKGRGGNGHEMPAVALTARATPGDALRAAQAGFAVHLPKPVEPQNLISVLLELTGR